VRILFDHGTPVPLKEHLPGHSVTTAYELGWSTLRNGELLARAEEQFDVLVTTDRNLRFQQNLAERKLAVVVLPTTSWPRLHTVAARIAAFVLARHPPPGPSGALTPILHSAALRRPLMLLHPACPGSRHSQKVQPLTGLAVIDMAAAEGESYLTPFSTSAPPSTRAR